MTQLRTFGALLVATLLVVGLGATSAQAGVTKKSGSFYQVKVETSGTDGDMTAKITVTGTKGYHCNMEYPWKFVGIEAEGVTFAKAKLKKADAASFTPEKVVFQVSYKAASAVKKVDGYLKLSLCDDKQCQMEKVNLSWPAK